MSNTDFSIAVRLKDKCLFYTESNAPLNIPRVYRDDNSIVFEIWVDNFDYDFAVKGGCAIVTAKEREK